MKIKTLSPPGTRSAIDDLHYLEQRVEINILLLQCLALRVSLCRYSIKICWMKLYNLQNSDLLFVFCVCEREREIVNREKIYRNDKSVDN